MRVEEQLRDIWRDFRDDLGPDGVTEMVEKSIFNRVCRFGKNSPVSDQLGHQEFGVLALHHGLVLTFELGSHTISFLLAAIFDNLCRST
jgi:hypothetical protein